MNKIKPITYQEAIAKNLESQPIPDELIDVVNKLIIKNISNYGIAEFKENELIQQTESLYPFFAQSIKIRNPHRTDLLLVRYPRLIKEFGEHWDICFPSLMHSNTDYRFSRREQGYLKD